MLVVHCLKSNLQMFLFPGAGIDILPPILKILLCCLKEEIKIDHWCARILIIIMFRFDIDKPSYTGIRVDSSWFHWALLGFVVTGGYEGLPGKSGAQHSGRPQVSKSLGGCHPKRWTWWVNDEKNSWTTWKMWKATVFFMYSIQDKHDILKSQCGHFQHERTWCWRGFQNLMEATGVQNTCCFAIGVLKMLKKEQQNIHSCGGWGWFAKDLVVHLCFWGWKIFSVTFCFNFGCFNCHKEKMCSHVRRSDFVQLKSFRRMVSLDEGTSMRFKNCRGKWCWSSYATDVYCT